MLQPTHTVLFFHFFFCEMLNETGCVHSQQVKMSSNANRPNFDIFHTQLFAYCMQVKTAAPLWSLIGLHSCNYVQKWRGFKTPYH